MNTKKIVPPVSQKNILLTFLALLLIGKNLRDLDTLFFMLTIAVTWMSIIYNLYINQYLRKSIDMKNSFIIWWILLLLVWPISSNRDIIVFLIILMITYILRQYLRVGWSPIINIATLWWLVLSFLSFFWLIDLFIWWSGVNYTISFFSYTIAYGTLVSGVACLTFIYLSRKYFYALWFIGLYAALWYMLLGSDFMKYSLSDGTIYFFFWVMALEPKTGVRWKFQLYYGLLLGLILILFLKFHIPWDYLLALWIINILFFLHVFHSKKKRVKKKYPKWKKWICPSCWYIYDPAIWDSDSDILPGTEFNDIPDDWECPECGIKKSDFIPYEEWAIEGSHGANIVAKTFLNPSTIELVRKSKDANREG